LLKLSLTRVADTIRGLTIDAVEYAGSGHAGTPLGCAELGAYLYGHFLCHHLKNPQWLNRDRFILSAGHASMLQYACLHLGGADLPLEELKRFRQLDSKTPSHPQYGLTVGIETTTGVDGQGIAHAVGQALGLQILGAKYNRPGFPLFDAKVVVLAGDGCLMEGVSHEACALAGHLKLPNLIVIHDSNQTCLDGLVSDSTSEDTRKRYEAYGWKVYEIDGHDFEQIHAVFSALRTAQTAPCLVIAKTMIGKGVSARAGSYLIHNGTLSQEERIETKEGMGFPDVDFYIPPEVSAFFAQKQLVDKEKEDAWQVLCAEWKKTYPSLHEELEKSRQRFIPDTLEASLKHLSMSNPISGRKASSLVLNYLARELPDLYGGSADLARSDMTHLNDHAVITAECFSGRNIKYGVREFAMGGIAIGLAQTGMIRPFIGTFLAFSDYMLSAIRMAALMRIPVIYQFTHDSIFIGQDGPTHQPVEHLAHLRAIPHLQVIRPADANEVKMAWLAALNYPGPTALIFSRQELPLCSGTECSYEEGMGKGAYIVRDMDGIPDYTLIATGSEVSLALRVAHTLRARVVSMPCWELFDQQPFAYQKHVLGEQCDRRVSLEAGSEMGWHKYVRTGKVISLSTFGKSARPQELAKEYGFTEEQVIQTIGVFV
jgi:transketolase